MGCVFNVYATVRRYFNLLRVEAVLTIPATIESIQYYSYTDGCISHVSPEILRRHFRSTHRSSDGTTLFQLKPHAAGSRADSGREL
jgi:hypothetical protein